VASVTQVYCMQLVWCGTDTLGDLEDAYDHNLVATHYTGAHLTGTTPAALPAPTQTATTSTPQVGGAA
jgi:hypothetical protein